MTRITSLKDLSGDMGNIMDLKHSGGVTWTVGETVTGADSGATAYVDSVNSNTNIISVIPTSDAFFQAMENIVGSVQTTSVVLLPCELTFFETTEKSVKGFVENYMNRIFGETETKTLKFTTEARQRYEKIPGKIDSLTSITLNGVLLVEDTDFWYNEKTGLIDFNREMNEGTTPNNLVIVYLDGTLIIPENVKQGANIMIIELWKMRNHSDDMRGASSLSFGGKSVSFAQPIQDKELNSLLPMVKGMLRSGSRWHTL